MCALDKAGQAREEGDTDEPVSFYQTLCVTQFSRTATRFLLCAGFCEQTMPSHEMFRGRRRFTVIAIL
jgi:hypothetical protein